MRRFLKNSLLGFLHLLAPGLTKGASVLMYHSIGDDGAFFTVPTAAFEEQLAYLAGSDRTVVTLATVIEKMRMHQSLAGQVVLTFDDGYASNYTQAFPLLKKYRVPATVFLATGYVDGARESTSEKKSFPMLTHAHIQEMQDSGLVTFMPHTHTHPAFSRISYDTAREEIERSRALIEEATGSPGVHFAYPYGKYTPEVVAYLRAQGWHSASTVESGLVTATSDPLLLPRNAVDRATSMTQFKAAVSDAIVWYTRLWR